jgi:GNAT superfamily N-acetyltransferase
VKSVSNLFRRGPGTPDPQGRGPDPAGGEPFVHPASPAQVTDALGHVLSSESHLADEAQVADFLDFVRQRGISLDDLWVAQTGADAEIAWAVFALVNPGRTLLLLGPGYVPEAPNATVAAVHLIHTVSAHYHKRGVHLAQVLLAPRAPALRQLYEACEFRHIADLMYLQATVRPQHKKHAEAALPEGFCWRTYSDKTHAQFSAIIADSYEQSLDCPALNGLRNVEDVLTGHRAAGEFDPGLWFMLCRGDLAQGVLLLSPSSQADTMELVYLGLPPAARGQKLGDVLMRQALSVTAARGLARLSLAVDSINAPALGLYYRHGMRRVSVKSALLRDLRQLTSPPAPPGA